MGCMSSKNKDWSHLDPVQLTMEHFDILRVIGKGAFGKVHAVKRRDTGFLYAMKVMDKNMIIDEEKVKNVLSERKLWVTMNHPLLVNIHAALSDTYKLYVIVDLMHGGDLRYHLDNDKRFSAERVRFYAVQMAETLKYLHGIGILHRDIKPDNLLFDRSGNVHFTDFNLSIRVPDNGVRGTAGTKPYMAPEIINRKRYGYPTDYWSVGIVLYELYTGSIPFYHKNWDRLKEKILYNEVNFPDGMKKPMRECIRGLLEKNPKKRWGYEEMANCKWLRGINFHAAGEKLVDTPWMPSSKRANVSGIHDLDDHFEPKVKPKPLTDEQQADFAVRSILYFVY
eukprot:TRINITY_DN1029_c0_g1_i2.p1 TRINITY_DN1029_c0_g1~~TRINITY_DN1029_c0_g1_i2.p1  ORF type:complete len:338 (-),score=69.34 TRINITY_DN1029_c0_g1_i2:810-1823(-)